MDVNRLSTALNLTGCISVIVGLYLIVFPTLSLDLAVGTLLIIIGAFLQSKLARFDVYGVTYGKWLEDKFRKIVPANMNPATDLKGRKVLSTSLNLLGIPLLILGLYLTTLPTFSLRKGIGDLLLMAGIFLQVKYKAYLGNNEPPKTRIS